MSSANLRSSQRSSSSPFRSRKAPVSSASPAASGNRPAARPTTPSSVSSTSARPTTPLSASQHTTSAKNNSPIESSDPPKAKENVTVTVRFRPLSAREINKGDEIAWYADGDFTVRNEFNASIGYSFDRVFGPATTTRHVYDVGAQHVVSGAMRGINGTVFAYGVTSSGKTHTMHGDQKSPGIIPLAVKDVFSSIQETPGREFLLRVSYLEIYNEVINDLLDPTSQNLRIREDSQGTYVEGIKEEVVLSPAHALSLIASGEEHRHVGSNNFNLLSSRSHTIFTLTIESSPAGDSEEDDDDDVTLSQLNLIDLAGSESSKTETTGLRRKEGSYINKSLLTLGTVISKLTDGKSTHIPYRDSKLTRLLQSSLSGHGRVSLICTITPASSNSEETHNTLKFAFRSKHVEIKAFQNKIMDEKSLIKKYQREIASLKHELQQLKRGMMANQIFPANNQEDLLNLKLQLEAGQVKLQSRLEEEEQAKAALMGRIQRLTRLILVSTKSIISSNQSEKHTHRRRHSFAEDELAYLPDRKHHTLDNNDDEMELEFSKDMISDSSCLDDSTKFDKRNRRRGMLGWLKLRKPDQASGLSTLTDNESSGSGSPSCANFSPQKTAFSESKNQGRKSTTRKSGDTSKILLTSEITQAGDLFYTTTADRCPPPTGTTITDQMDLMQEQVKMLAGEVALCSSSLKRLSEQAAKNPDDFRINEHMKKLNNEIREKKLQIRILEQRMFGSFESNPQTVSNFDLSQALSKLATQLNEKTFELEIMSADNRILQDQLQMKISENAEIQETVLMLRHQLNSLTEKNLENQTITAESEAHSRWDENIYTQEGSRNSNDNISLKSKVLMQASEIENLIEEKARLAEEASYAKDLAADAAVELRHLAEEVTKLSYQNAKLIADLKLNQELYSKRVDDENLLAELRNEVRSRCQREAELLRRIDEGKEREAYLESELANMWVLISKMKKSNGDATFYLPSKSLNGFRQNLHQSVKTLEEEIFLEELKAAYESEKIEDGARRNYIQTEERRSGESRCGNVGIASEIPR